MVSRGRDSIPLFFLITLLAIWHSSVAWGAENTIGKNCVSRYVLVPDSHDGLAYETDAAGKRTGRMLGKALYGDPLRPKKCFVPIKIRVWEVEPIGDGELESHVQGELWNLYCKYPEMIATDKSLAIFILNNYHRQEKFRNCVERIPQTFGSLKAAGKLPKETEQAIISEMLDLIGPERRWLDVALAAAGHPIDKEHKLMFRPTKNPKFSYGEHGLYVTKEGKDSWAVPLFYDSRNHQLKSGRGALLTPAETSLAFQALCEQPEAALAEHSQLVFLLERLSATEKNSASISCAERLADQYLAGVTSTGARIAPDNSLRVADLGEAKGAIKAAIVKRFAEHGRTILPLPGSGPRFGEFVLTKPGSRFAHRLNGETYLLDEKGETTLLTMFDVTRISDPMFKSEKERTSFLQEWFDHLQSLDPKYKERTTTGQLEEVRSNLARGYLVQGEGTNAASLVRQLREEAGQKHQAAALHDYLRRNAPDQLAWEKMASDELAPGIKVRKEEPACRVVCDLYDSYDKEWGKIQYGFSMDKENAGPYLYAATSLQALFVQKAARYCAKRKEGAGSRVVKDLKEKLKRMEEKSLPSHFEAYATHFSLVIARDEGDMKKAKELEQKLRILAQARSLHKSWAGGSGLQTYGLSSVLSSLSSVYIPSAESLGKSDDDPTSLLMKNIEANLKARYSDFSFSNLSDPTAQEQALALPYQFDDAYQASSKCDAAARNVTTYMALYRSDPEKFRPILLRVLENFRDYRGSLILDYGRETVHQGLCAHASYYWGPTLPYAVDFVHWLQKNEKWTPQELARLDAVDQSLQGALETATTREKIFSPKERESMGPSATWEIPLAGISMLGYIKECNGVQGDGIAFLHDWSPKVPVDKGLVPHDIAAAFARPTLGH